MRYNFLLLLFTFKMTSSIFTVYNLTQSYKLNTTTINHLVNTNYPVIRQLQTEPFNPIKISVLANIIRV